MNMAEEVTKKLIVIGDGQCGKTSLLSAFVTGQFPETDSQPAFVDKVVSIQVKNTQSKFSLWDTVSEPEFENLRLLCYPETDVIITCFSFDNPASYTNIRKKWIPEMKQHCAKVPFILVGNKMELKYDRPNHQTSTTSSIHPSRSEGQQLARQIGACAYLECSAKFKTGVQEVFQTAAKASLLSKRKKEKCTFL